MTSTELTEEIRAKALEIGFVDVGFATTDDFPEYETELDIREGYEWFGGAGLRMGCHLHETSPEAKSIICLVYSCADTYFPPEIASHVGRVYEARCYGADTFKKNTWMVNTIKDMLRESGYKVFDERGLMQVPDRAAAARAGVITFGRNNFAYHGKDGSFITISTIVTDAELDCVNLPPRRPCPDDCRKCIDACPTHAMDDDGRLHANRCILYTQVFPFAALDQNMLPLIGQHIHGCDECQLACPRNKTALERGTQHDEVLDRIASNFSIVDQLVQPEGYLEENAIPIMSAYFSDPDRYRRIAAVALGNSDDPSYIPLLEQAAQECDPESESAAGIVWAIEQLKKSK